MGSRPLAALIGAVGIVALSACGSAPPLAKAPPQIESITVAASTITPSPATPSTTTTRTGVYGDPAAAAKYWQPQSLEDNCGLLSVADVVGEITGHAPTEQQVIALAVSTPSGTNPGPIYAPVNDPSHANGTGGIEMADEVVLLKHYGIKSVMTEATTHPDQTGLPALRRYLTENRKIIAWVNSAVIWNTSDQRTAADHFLVVTGIDTNTDVVHLNDPGADHADEQVSLATFAAAWQTGTESIVVTAAP
ncbi:C39 family peptidase [Mycobacterium camsae]|uniref:C39 family peptidase n=1 Tax=Mycobacterium gordonae TaxID=1778 RepID=UPI00198187AC|nr:C39 family peptidase [Mycobacterium gordonae]